MTAIGISGHMIVNSAPATKTISIISPAATKTKSLVTNPTTLDIRLSIEARILASSDLPPNPVILFQGENSVFINRGTEKVLETLLLQVEMLPAACAQPVLYHQRKSSKTMIFIVTQKNTISLKLVLMLFLFSRAGTF